MRGVKDYIARDMIKWFRSPVSVVSMLVMPAAWLIFVGLALPVVSPAITWTLSRRAFSS